MRPASRRHAARAGPQPRQLRELAAASDQRPARADPQLCGQLERRLLGIHGPGAASRAPGGTAQQPLVGLDRFGRRGGAELVAQQRPQALEHPHALGDVAARGERLHQQHVPGLAVRLGLDQRPRRAFDRCQLRATEPQPRATDHLERLQPRVVELAARRLEPAGVRARQQPSAGDVERHLGERPRGAGVATLERLPGAPELGARGFEVHPHRLGQVQDQLFAAGQRGPAQPRAQPRQQRAKRPVLRCRCVLGPQRPDQLLAADVASAVQEQVREQQAYLPAAEPVGPLDAVDFDGQSPAQLNASALTTAGRHGNVLETYRQRRLRILPGVDRAITDSLGGAHEVTPEPRGRTAVIEESRLVAHCECGAQLAGASEQELFEAVQQHLAHHHPQLLGALEPDVVFQMAEAVGGADTPTGARGQST